MSGLSAPTAGRPARSSRTSPCSRCRWARDDPASLRPLLPYRPAVKIETVDAFARHVLILERSDGLEQLRVLRLADGDEHVVAQPEPAYKLSAETSREWDTDVARFGYSSLTNPPSSVDYDMESRLRSTVKRATVGGGYEPAAYRSERLWAEAPDGTLVPISLVCRRDQATRRFGALPSLWLRELRVPDRPLLFPNPPQPARAGVRLRHRTRPRWRRTGPALVRAGTSDAQKEHFYGLHRLR